MDSYIESLLGEKEHVLLVSRQHGFLLLGSILLDGLFSVGIIFVLYTFLTFLDESLMFYISLIAAIISLLAIFKDFLDWRDRFYIITNRRVLQTTGYFMKSEIDSSLEKVNDAKMSQTLMGRILNYGDIEILTGSELGMNLFKRIRNPVMFKMKILDAKEALINERYSNVPEDEPASV